MSFKPVLTFATNVGPSVRRVLVQPDGKIMVGGGFTNAGESAQQNLIRLNSDGTIDASFNPGLISVVNLVELLPNGKYIVAAAALIRLNNNGSVDNTFQPAPSVSNLYNFINAIVVEPDGSMIIGGSFTIAVNGIERTGLIRLRSNGTLDTTFFPSVVIGENASSAPGVFAIERQADGRIVVGGNFLSIDNITRLGVARLLAGPVRAASISGRVLTRTRRGLANASVSLTDQNENIQASRTNSFGYYHFEEVEAGQTVIVTVVSKRFRFAPQVITLTTDLAELNFTAQ